MTSVLIVDDEPDVRLVARIILEGAGYDVSEAASGEEALDTLDRDGPPGVILLDVRMPGIDGWEVLHRLRKSPGEHRTLPVVVFTADMSSVDRAPVEFAEREFFLAKPFAPDQLVASIEAAATC